MLLPVRHHSPACARMVREFIQEKKPAAVLIEGPADFNERIDELFAEHSPPIAIYSYVAWEDLLRQGAYYPMCEYSPEWQALRTAHAQGAVVRFIDLPFAVRSRVDRRVNLYADGRLRGSDYVKAVCRNLGVENFDDAWDIIAEQEPNLSPGEIAHRLGEYCRCLREMDDAESQEYDIRREEFMAAHVRAANAEFGAADVVVITGGYHTSGLERLLAEPDGPADVTVPWPEGIVERGIALTPYSYERLDSLTGYDAGMPSPGFYHQAWISAHGTSVHTPLLKAIVHRLRDLKQTASTADLIAVETCAQALAALRGNARVWRRDLIDAITAALIKDDVHETHPFIMALHAVLRGGERGRLAAGTSLPPLVHDIQKQLKEFDLTPEKRAAEHTFTIGNAAEMKKSQLLHRVRILGVPGFERIAGVDFSNRTDLTSLKETWRIRWLPEQDAQMIECSRYGSALDEAVAAYLLEQGQGIERDSARAALLLLESVLGAILTMAEPLRLRISEIVHEDGSLSSVATAIDHLLYLYAWDDALGTRGSHETGLVLKESFARAVWLLESGSPAGTSADEINAVKLMRNAFERAEEPMQLNRVEFCEVLGRVQADSQRSPGQRGACAGALWSMHSADPAAIRRDLLLFFTPDHLGDFLTGLFALAREEAQRDTELLRAIHSVVVAWNDDSFLTALPSLRLAFMYFTAREKLYLARSLFKDEADTVHESEPAPLVVSTAEAAEAMAFEARIFEIARKYGVKFDLN